MPFYLSQYVGSGTRQNPYRPVGSDQPDWASIDLRPSGHLLDGGGLNACLLRTEEPFSDARAQFLGDDKLETLTNQQKNFLTNKLGVDLSSPNLLRDIIAILMNYPPTNGWKAIKPGRLNWEVWLGELIWEAPRISGGASDDFNRANESPILSPWVKAGGGNIRIATNNIDAATSTDCWWYYSGAASSADQYAQAKIITPAGPDAGPAVRINADVDCYSINTLLHEYVRFLNNSITSLANYSSTAINDVVRIEVEGSTIRGYINGAPSGVPSTTDSNISAAGLGVGMFMFETGHEYDDWSGGDLFTPPPAATDSILFPTRFL